MLFTNSAVLLTIAIAWALYYVPAMRRHQLALLVVASLAVYAHEAPAMLALLLASALVNAFTSYRVMVHAGNARARRAWAVGAIAFNLLLLAFFKYNHLLAQMLAVEFSGEGDSVGRMLLMLPLPAGISFYTFHGISLLVDTWRAPPAARPPRRRHIAHTLLYLCFFPQLVAGPITKANFFYPQIGPKEWRDIDWDTVLSALVTGYFLKLVVANNLAAQTFWLQYPYFIGMSRNDLLLLLFGYSMQIFADFAGYSLIAIGLAGLFGYRLPTNFNFPYLSRSFAEFWTRWHMSLSSWLREYLYIPLGGSRHGRIRTYFNLLAVMVLGGLWHGAALSYAVWGAWHGVALAAERAIAGPHPREPSGPVMSVLRWALVFSVVTLGWLLFKLPDFSHVLAYFQAIADSPWAPGLSNRARAILLLSLPVVLYHAHHALRDRPWAAAALKQPAFGAMAFFVVMNAGPDTPFIYFQF